MDKQKHRHIVCLLDESNFKRAKRQQTSHFQRFKMNQQYQISLLHSLARHSSVFNITEYIRHKRQMDFNHGLALTNVLS